ncbi:MAG: glycosyltransferase family 2 protein [Marinomonas sp.]|uniref:glycosyltransferase family 2 protein n=1 Tax=Marinomonas sp. TaxID=1904862 RepID=UPI003F9B2BFC
MSSPILSVIMPTHNRANYAISAINSILSFPDMDIELIVTDTSEDSQLKDALSNISDNRLKYSYVKEALSMTENYNLAMSLATGTYVCLIGDDDTITQDAIIASRWAKENCVEVVSPLVVANYAWPDFKSRFFGNSHAGRLYIKKKFGDYKWCNSKENLIKALNKGALGTEGLPKVYHSLVSKKMMDLIKEMSGNYFHGVSPDVSGAVSLAIVSDEYLEVNYPLTLPGAAGKSNSGRSALNTHKGSLKDDSHTKRFKNLNWPLLLPQFTSVETVWAQAAYSTLEAFDVKEIKKYNFIKLYAVCYIRHFENRQLISAALSNFRKANNYSYIKSVFLLSLEMFKDICSLIKRYSKRLLTPTASGGRNYIPDIENVFFAQIELINYLKKRGQSQKYFKKILNMALADRTNN